MITVLRCAVAGQGLHDISVLAADAVSAAGIEEGLCTLFIRHTSASLLIQENYDPSAKADMEMWLNKLVPEDDPDYTHTLEGPDDMPAHIKSALTATSVSIPVTDGKLMLGTWQQIILLDFDNGPRSRMLVCQLRGNFTDLQR
jgi:secondary thiamine-phosphate synthase enzyme